MKPITNDIKKLIYKDQTLAYLRYIQKGVALYRGFIRSEDIEIFFEVPVDDMGDARFESVMEGKLLIRWAKY